MRLQEFDALAARAAGIFRKKTAIYTGDGLSRGELRLLERHGLVEKTQFFKQRKFVDTNSTLVYVWKATRELLLGS